MSSAEPPRDRVVLRGLRGFGRHGVLESERRMGQTFLVDIALELDTRQAASTDDVAELTPVYVALPRGVKRAAEDLGWSPDLR